MVVIMKNIWYRRNKFVFYTHFLSPAQVIRIAAINLEDYSSALRKGGEGVVQKCITRRGLGWRRPEGESFKANFDAAINEVEQTMGLGVVIRDCNGQLLAAKCANRKCRSSPFIAECSAMLEAMELCKELGFWEVWLEGDAKEVIDAVNREEDDDSRFGHVIEDLKQSLRQSNAWRAVFTHREGNEVAHHLAKIALHCTNDQYWIEEGPESIKNLLAIDRLQSDIVTVVS
ncbi:uncharacterized protein LOC118347671 [Juglans regia]|uniref:Uncharacterized protein LOC118347671 n=1 Tax=Juglans regia TaxID=51240 RepID=A0A6P9EHH2_JUGRE|nr:uncharacterized protein LOC118347671 [Juglans regia]